MSLQGKPGRFISFEGGEGTGKTTQIRLLADRLRQNGIDVLTTREPGGTPSAELIRGLLVSGETDRWLPVTEAYLHAAARVEHVTRLIRPKLQSGAWVLSDRFYDSSRAYQGMGQGLGLELIDQLARLSIGTFKPDLTIVLDLPVEIGLPRANLRSGGGEDRYERMGTVFHEKLRTAFLEIASAEPERCHVIDARPDIETVSDAIWADVKSTLLDELL